MMIDRLNRVFRAAEELDSLEWGTVLAVPQLPLDETVALIAKGC
jgi:hypothetical protein